MIEIIIKGIIIGLFISVPLGPIGMLCVQRTLNKGKIYGIFTGLGATTSDLIYTVITLSSLSIVMDVVDQYRFAIQLLGSLVIVFFGYYIYRSNPATQPKPNEPKKESVFGDYITSLILTLSNPLVIFVLIALFARFEFINIKTTFVLSVVGISSILVGAILWWSTLTFLISRFKDKLNMTGLKIINRITGTIILLIGIVGIAISLV